MPNQIMHKGEMLVIEGNRIKRSKNNGSSWYKRTTISSTIGDPVDLMDAGNELIITGTKRRGYSKDSGVSFYKTLPL